MSPDPLSEVLHDLRLSRASYGRCELAGPWAIEFPALDQARFHFVAAGECWLNTPTLGWQQLRSGDVALLPHGTGHVLADARRKPRKTIDEIAREEIGERTYRIREGGNGALTLLFCCSVSFDQPALHPLLELMPPLLQVSGGATADPTLPVLLQAMAEEVGAQRVGAATVMTRLADVVITRAVRAWVEAQCEDSDRGWLAAIRDPKIGRVLAAIHRRPDEPWSIEALAAVAKMSRSVFHARFTNVVGLPPAKYLARWRMRLASLWLSQDGLTVTEVATRLGYESEAAFSRAFKRSVGKPPSALHRNA